MKKIEDLSNLFKKKVLLRLDLNVPLKNEKITDTTRIDKIIPTLEFLIKKKSKIIIISHIGRPNGKINKELSMLPVTKYLSKKLNIYNEIPELLSVSLGAAETTLINLTSAYAPFVNGGIKIEPKLISRIQDRRGKTIFQETNRECIGCDKFINEDIELPKIKNNSEKAISEETAYQMNSIFLNFF